MRTRGTAREQTPSQLAANLSEKAFALLKSGDTEGAYAAWTEALELVPSNRDYAANLRKLAQKRQGR